MLNILQIEDRLKDMSKDSVIQALNNPNPTIPPFLALAELNRRKRMEDESRDAYARNIRHGYDYGSKNRHGTKYWRKSNDGKRNARGDPRNELRGCVKLQSYGYGSTFKK